MARRRMSIEEFKAYLNLIPDRVRRAVNTEVHRQADGLASDMKRVVERDTGVLSESITVQHRELQSFVRAGGDATTKAVENGLDGDYDYAMANEFGNARVDSEPFFWPMYRLKKKGIKAAIQKSVREAIKKA